MKMLIIAKGYFHRDIFTSEYFHKHTDLIDFFHKLHLLLLIMRQQCFRSLNFGNSYIAIKLYLVMILNLYLTSE